MTAPHAHPQVSKSDVFDLNRRYAPWRIEKAHASANRENVTGRGFVTQARNTETGEVIYRCEGWTMAARGQALNAILEARAKVALGPISQPTLMNRATGAELAPGTLLEGHYGPSGLMFERVHTFATDDGKGGTGGMVSVRGDNGNGRKMTTTTESFPALYWAFPDNAETPCEHCGGVNGYHACDAAERGEDSAPVDGYEHGMTDAELAAIGERQITRPELPRAEHVRDFKLTLTSARRAELAAIVQAIEYPADVADDDNRAKLAEIREARRTWGELVTPEVHAAYRERTGRGLTWGAWLALSATERASLVTPAESAQVAALRAGARALRQYGPLPRPAQLDTDAAELDRMADKLAAITSAPVTGGCPLPGETTPKDMSAKPSARLAGLRGTYWNGQRATWVSVYDAEPAGIDVSPDRWAVVCERHSTMVGVSTLKLAHEDARSDPGEFCEECRGELVELPTGEFVSMQGNTEEDSMTASERIREARAKTDNAAHPVFAALSPEARRVIADNAVQGFQPAPTVAVPGGPGWIDPGMCVRCGLNPPADKSSLCNPCETGLEVAREEDSDAGVLAALRAAKADGLKMSPEDIGAYGPDVDSALARIADNAADGFTFDTDSEDAESCAWRAVDILKDASAETAAKLAGVIFGNGEQVPASWHGGGYAHTDYATWENETRASKGLPDVAYVLVNEYPDDMARLLSVLGADGSTCDDAFKAGLSALAAVATLDAFTYGGGPLEGRSTMQLHADAARYCGDAIRDAAFNARLPEDAGQDIGADSRPWCDR